MKKSKPTDKRVVLITGTRTGIGRHLAEHFLSGGCLVVGCSRGECDIDDGNYRHHQLDVTAQADLTAMFMDVRKSFGSLDVLINNAGMLTTSPAVLTAPETVENVFAVNFHAMVSCCRNAVPIMRKTGSGRIVNLSSVAVPHAPEGNSIYSSSKAAVEQFTRTFAKEVYPFGITVNALGLPPVENTGMADALADEAVQKTLDSMAVKRMITSGEVAHAVEFFIDEASAALTGQTLYLGGP